MYPRLRDWSLLKCLLNQEPDYIILQRLPGLCLVQLPDRGSTGRRPRYKRGGTCGPHQ